MGDTRNDSEAIVGVVAKQGANSRRQYFSQNFLMPQRIIGGLRVVHLGNARFSTRVSS